jgi:hypothetical protein
MERSLRFSQDAFDTRGLARPMVAWSRVSWINDIREECDLDVAALSPFLDSEVLNVNASRTFSLVRVHYCGGSLVICIKQCRPREAKLDKNGPLVLGALGGEQSYNSLPVLEVATIGYSFDTNAIAAPAR